MKHLKIYEYYDRQPELYEIGDYVYVTDDFFELDMEIFLIENITCVDDDEPIKYDAIRLTTKEQYEIDEKSIVRVLVPEEIKDLEIKLGAKKYNL